MIRPGDDPTLARTASIVLVEDRVGDERKAYAMRRSISAAYPALLLRLFQNYCCAMSDLVPARCIVG